MLRSHDKLHAVVNGKRVRERDGVRCSVLVGSDLPQGVERKEGGGSGKREGERLDVPPREDTNDDTELIGSELRASRSEN